MIHLHGVIDEVTFVISISLLEPPRVLLHQCPPICHSCNTHLYQQHQHQHRCRHYYPFVNDTRP